MSENTHWATPTNEPSDECRNPKRNQGNVIVEVFDQPEPARCKEDSEHPELWEPNYVWRPDKPYRPENPEDPYVPAMEIDPATRPETMKLAKMMVDRIRRRLGLTSLAFQHLDDMIRAIGLPKDRICTYCWTGEDVSCPNCCQCSHKQ